MREKLNSNPLYQAALVGVLLLVAGIFAMSSMGGSSEEEEGSSATGEAATTVTATVSGEAPEGQLTALPAPGSGVGAPPPTPSDVVSAFDANETVALLFVRDGGIDDDMVAADVRRLSPMSKVATFVVPASRISHYAAIAQGVELDRVPALVVLRPKLLSPNPAATISYGYQSPASVEQAIIDARYKGRTVPYHP
jgi:hypothetical protein